MKKRLRVYRMNDCDWWIGTSFESTTKAYLAHISPPYRKDALCEPRMLRRDELLKLIYADEDNGHCTFAKQLEVETLRGGKFPRYFASTEM